MLERISRRPVSSRIKQRLSIHSPAGSSGQMTNPNSPSRSALQISWDLHPSRECARKVVPSTDREARVSQTFSLIASAIMPLMATRSNRRRCHLVDDHPERDEAERAGAKVLVRPLSLDPISSPRASASLQLNSLSGRRAVRHAALRGRVRSIRYLFLTSRRGRHILPVQETFVFS